MFHSRRAPAAFTAAVAFFGVAAKAGLARSRRPVAVSVAATATDAARNRTTATGSAALPRG